MADRYWVGGTASWNSTAGTKWATTSGGAGGASIPTSADDVFFDAASGAVTCTISTGNTGARSITCAGFAGTLAGTAAISVAGSITLTAGMTFSYTGTVTLTATGTLTSAGKTFGNITINGAGITVTLADAVTCGLITLAAGSFNTSASNFSVTARSFQTSGSTPKVITLNGSTVLVTGSTFSWYILNGSNTTVDAGTYTINLTGVGGSFYGGGKTYNNVAILTTTGSITIFDTNTFNNLTFANATDSTAVAYFERYKTQTITGTLSLNAGTTGVARRLVTSTRSSDNSTISVATLATMADVDFRDITVTGAAAPLTGARIGDRLGNSGITFTAARTVYWVLPAGGNWDSAAWSTTSGNTGGSTTAVPLAQDSIVIDNAGLTAGNTITFIQGFTLPNISFATRSIAATLDFASTNDAYAYGNFILSSSVTVTAITTFLFFSHRTGTITLTTAGVTLPNGLLMEIGEGGTVQLGSALVTDNGISLYEGNLALNGFNLTAFYFQIYGGASHTIDFGTNSITITGTGSGSTSPWYAPDLGNFSYTGTPLVNFAGDGEIRHGSSSGGSEAKAVSFTRIGPGTGAVNFGESHIRNLVFSSPATWTIAGATKKIYGNLTLAASTTMGAGASNAFLTFAGTGTQQITMAGKTYDGPVNFSGAGGTYELQDALTLGSARALTFSNGTLKLKAGVTSTVGSFLTTGTTLKFLQSTTSGAQATISDASGTNTVTYLSIQDSNATGGATFTATSTTNVNAGNNTGWILPSVSGSFFAFF